MLKKILSLVLCFGIGLIAFCSVSCKKEVVETTFQDLVDATNLTFNENGEYTTVVPIKDGVAKKIKLEDVRVYYYLVNQEAMTAALAISPELENFKYEDFTTEIEMDVNSVKAKSNNELEIAFTDLSASVIRNECYIIKIEKFGILAQSNVEFKEISLTTEVESVKASDVSRKITLSLSESSFKEDLSAEQIILYGSFSNLSVESISARGKNLTFQLVGQVEKDVYSNAFLDGAIAIDSSAVVDASVNLNVCIPVEGDEMGVIPSSLTFENGHVVVSVNAYEFVDETLTKEDFEFFADGVSIIEADLLYDAIYQLTLSIDGVESIADAIQALDETEFEIAGSELSTIYFPKATFYPVFDFVEDVDGALQITVLLYVNNGTFKEVLSTSDVEFGEDFAGGEVVSFTRDSDYAATLVFNVPANNQTSESLDKNGKIILKEATMIDTWGLNSSEQSYLRNYNQLSMGKFQPSDLLKYTALKETTLKLIDSGYSKVMEYAPGIVDAVSGIYNFLQLIGVVESEKAKLDRVLGELDKIQNTLKSISEKVETLETLNLEDRVDSFDMLVQNLLYKANTLNSIFLSAQGYYYDSDDDGQLKQDTSKALVVFNDNKDLLDTINNSDTFKNILINDVVVTKISQPDDIVKTYTITLFGETFYYCRGLSLSKSTGAFLNMIDELKNTGEISRETFNKVDSDPSQVYELYKKYVEKNAKVEEAKIYTRDLINAILEKGTPSHVYDDDYTLYYNFAAKYEELVNALDEVCAALKVPKARNPIAKFDELCVKSCNFDTTAANLRELYRENVKFAIGYAYSMMLIYNKYPLNVNNPVILDIYKKCSDAIGIIDSMPVITRNDNKAYVYLLNGTIDLDKTTQYESLTTEAIQFVEKKSGNSTTTYVGDWTDENIQLFIKRMSCETLAEELEVAGVTFNTKCSYKYNERFMYKTVEVDIPGMAFDFYKEGSRYYAKYIPFDGNTVKTVATCVCTMNEDLQNHPAFKPSRGYEYVYYYNKRLYFMLLW